VPDPDDLTNLQGEPLRKFMEAVIEDDGASIALRKHVAARYPAATGTTKPPLRTESSAAVIAEVLPACDAQPELRNPPHRRLRVYATDPSLSARLDTAGINEVTIDVRWEDLEKGPTGEYLT